MNSMASAIPWASRRYNCSQKIQNIRPQTDGRNIERTCDAAPETLALVFDINRASEAYELQILAVYFLGTRCEIDSHRYSPKICPAEAELQVARKTAEPSRDASYADGRRACKCCPVLMIPLGPNMPPFLGGHKYQDRSINLALEIAGMPRGRATSCRRYKVGPAREKSSWMRLRGYRNHCGGCIRSIKYGQRTAHPTVSFTVQEEGWKEPP